MEKDVILSSIKTQVNDIIPGAKIMLFGSRAYGVPTAESDWDILVLTKTSVYPALKKKVHNAVFPISVQIGAFINLLIVPESDWQNNPSYYPLQQTVANRMVML